MRYRLITGPWVIRGKTSPVLFVDRFVAGDRSDVVGRLDVDGRLKGKEEGDTPLDRSVTTEELRVVP
jgi:hypothetical protein